MMRLFTQQKLIVGELVKLPTQTSHRLQKVMRARVGEELILFNGEGGEYLGELTALNKRAATVAIKSFIDCERESPLTIGLIQGISRGNRMDYTIQKAVELGVTKIFPVATKRTMVKLDDERKHNRHVHWLGVIHHACEQSGRTKIPDLHPALPLKEIASLAHIEQSFFLDTQATTPITEIPQPTTECYIIAGPEGGFSDEERSWIKNLSITAVKLGPRTLRTETAALAMLSILQQRWGDL